MAGLLRRITGLFVGGRGAPYSRYADASGGAGEDEEGMGGHDDLSSLGGAGGPHPSSPQFSLEEPPSTAARKGPHGRRPHASVLVGAVVMVFLIGFLLGYVAIRSRYRSACPASPPASSSSEQADESAAWGPRRRAGGEEEDDEEEEEEVSQDELDDLFLRSLSDKSLATFHRTLATPSSDGAAAAIGSAQFYFDLFQSVGLATSVSSHFATVDSPSSTQPNTVRLLGRENVTLDLGGTGYYSPYSATGTVRGCLVYVNYGREEDFRALSRVNVSCRGCLALLRDGQTGHMDKVRVGERQGCVGVLIYPDPSDRPDLEEGTAVLSHVHSGLGDPFSTGFPAFNQSHPAPSASSGLPTIPCVPIGFRAAQMLMRSLSPGSLPAPPAWCGRMDSPYRLGPGFNSDVVAVEMTVASQRAARQMHNVLGMLKGHREPDRVVVLGASRASLGPSRGGGGGAVPTAGGAALLEIARTLAGMSLTQGFPTRRSLLFASWDGGEFGAIGATEWLKTHMSSLQSRVIAYIDLDNIVLGTEEFVVSTTPLLADLISEAINKVPMTKHRVLGTVEDWASNLKFPVNRDSSMFAFLAMAGIPSLHLGFTGAGGRPYPPWGTREDVWARWSRAEGLAAALGGATRVAGLLAARAASGARADARPNLYVTAIADHIDAIDAACTGMQALREELEALPRALGSLDRATYALSQLLNTADWTRTSEGRALSDRVTRVELAMLNPYTSPLSDPFRHLLFGTSPVSLPSLLLDLQNLQNLGPAAGPGGAQREVSDLRRRLALLVTSLQGAAVSIRDPSLAQLFFEG